MDIVTSILGLLIAAAGLFVGSSVWKSKAINDPPSTNHQPSDGAFPVIRRAETPTGVNASTTNTFLSVNVMLPFQYNDADIFVDEARARINNRNASIVTVEVPRQDRPLKFQIKKGSFVREEYYYISSNNTTIEPFQY